MTTENHESTEKKWHQYPYVWFLIGIPLTSVILSIVLIYLAVSGRDPLVIDDYYRQGKAINKILTRDKNASQLGITASVQLSQSGTRNLNLVLQAAKNFSFPDIIVLKMMHATRRENDQQIRFYRTPEGQYQGQGKALVPGKWYLEIGTEQWRISATTMLPDDQSIVLQPDV